MPIPDYQTLMLPVLRLAAQGETRVSDVELRLADDFNLSQEERDRLLASGRQRLLNNRIHWAKHYMVKAGLLDAPRRGWFVASAEGRRLLATNPVRIDNALMMQYPAFREFYRGGNQGDAVAEPADLLAAPPLPASTETPEDQIEEAYAALQAGLRADLLARILQNSPAFFERMIIDLLIAMGYGGTHLKAAEQLGRSGDGGVDGVINEDRLGLDRVYIQAKRYADKSIGRPEVQAFLGSLIGKGASKGVFVTTSTFSKQAEDFVQHLPQRIILIDGRMLTDLMIEHGVGVRVGRVVEFKRVDEDFFSEED